MNQECPLCGAVTTKSYCSCSEASGQGKYVIVREKYCCFKSCCVLLFNTLREAVNYVKFYFENDYLGKAKRRWRVVLIREENLGGLEIGDDPGRANIVDNRLKALLECLARSENGWCLEDSYVEL